MLMACSAADRSLYVTHADPFDRFVVLSRMMLTSRTSPNPANQRLEHFFCAHPRNLPNKELDRPIGRLVEFGGVLMLLLLRLHSTKVRVEHHGCLVQRNNPHTHTHGVHTRRDHTRG
eukprot:Sspe_Gene.31821::Locus_15653_Transcript_1_1_Confidence_1.000_Length_1243::g.31821::m.31821